MRPGDRVELVKKLAGRLAGEDWEDVRLVLHQFGFDVIHPENWDGDLRSYAVRHLEDAPDEQLIELQEYLFGESSPEGLDAVDLPWEPGTFRLFITHTSPHAELAGKVREYFAPWRVDAFVAHTTIAPTREWEREIEAALGSCHALTALVSKDFSRSHWCDQEVGYCLARRVPIVPVRLGVDPHGFIARFQAVRADDGRPHSVADGIFRALARHPALGELMAAPVVHRFAESGSFNGARANFPLVQELRPELWTRELVEFAERAVVENGQLKDAVLTAPAGKRVPDATVELLAPIRDRLGMNEQNQTRVGVGDDDIPF